MINYITTNWAQLLVAAAAGIAFAKAVAVLTPTTKDDEVVGKVESWLNKLLKK